MKFYLVNPSDLAKTEKTHGSVRREQEKSPVQIPHPSKGTIHSKMPGVCQRGRVGGGMLKFRIDRRISKGVEVSNHLKIAGIRIKIK